MPKSMALKTAMGLAPGAAKGCSGSKGSKKPAKSKSTKPKKSK